MTERQEPRVKLPAPSHMGNVVKDLDQAIHYYDTFFGWGPFQVREVDMKRFPNFFRGKPGTGRFKVAIGRCGSMVIELFQAMEGETPYAEFSGAKGEGIHHLGFQLEDFDIALAALTEGGMESIFHGKSPQGSFAYLNTDKVGGVVFELLSYSPFG